MDIKVLKKRSEFLEMKEKGETFTSPAFLISLYKGGEGVKVGYIVTKKTGNAVARNKSKRRMRAIIDALIRLNHNFKPPSEVSGLTIVLIARKFSLDRPFEKMLQETKEILVEQGCQF
jgi:ribonuclease P protein component